MTFLSAALRSISMLRAEQSCARADGAPVMRPALRTNASAAIRMSISGPLDDLRSTHDSGFSVAASSEEMACGLEMLRKTRSVSPTLRRRCASDRLNQVCKVAYAAMLRCTEIRSKST
jgi:hypothetical protein